MQMNTSRSLGLPTRTTGKPQLVVANVAYLARPMAAGGGAASSLHASFSSGMRKAGWLAAVLARRHRQAERDCERGEKRASQVRRMQCTWRNESSRAPPVQVAAMVGEYYRGERGLFFPTGSRRGARFVSPALPSYVT